MDNTPGIAYHIIAKRKGSDLERSGTLTMKEYKMIKTTEKDAENVMNNMAAHGWEVKCVTYWSYWWVHLMITFERDIKE